MAKAQATITPEEAATAAQKAIHKTGESVSQTLFFLDIGPHGVAKTSKLGTLPKPLILDVEGGEAGTIPLRDKNVDKWTISSWKDFREAMRFLESGSHSYESIGIDDLVQLQEHCLADVVAGSNYDFMARELWSVALERMLGVVAYMRILQQKRGMNVAVTCLQEVVMDQDKGIPIGVEPSLKGKFAQVICGKFDVVGFSVSKRVKAEGSAKDDEGQLVFGTLTKPFQHNTIFYPGKDRWNVLETVEKFELNGPGLAGWIERISAWSPETAAQQQPTERADEIIEDSVESYQEAATEPQKETKPEPQKAKAPKGKAKQAPPPATIEDFEAERKKAVGELTDWWKSIEGVYGSDQLETLGNYLTERVKAKKVNHVNELKNAADVREILGDMMEFEAKLEAPEPAA